MRTEAPANLVEWSIEVDRCSQAEWERDLNCFEDATIYQTWAFGAVSWGCAQLSHIKLKSDGITVGMAQLRLVTIPIVRRGVAYVRWGPLWRRKDTPRNPEVYRCLLSALRDEYVRRRKLLLRIVPNTFSEDTDEKVISSGAARLGFKRKDSRCYRTFLVDISPSLEQVRKSLDQKWRNQLNRSEKNGLVVLAGTDDRLYGMFKAIYEEMMERKCFDTTVDVHEFERIQRSLPESQKMQILVAVKDGKPVSAIVASTIGRTGIYLLGATSNEGMQHKGSYLLQWRMIEHLKECGCHCYDLGGINPERNPGVYHFKSGFSGADKSHVGEYEISGSAVSSWIVSIAESRRKASAPERLNDRALELSSAMLPPRTQKAG